MKPRAYKTPDSIALAGPNEAIDAITETGKVSVPSRS